MPLPPFIGLWVRLFLVLNRWFDLVSLLPFVMREQQLCWAAMVLLSGVTPASNDHPYTNQQCGTSPQSTSPHRSSFVIPEQTKVHGSSMYM